MKRLGAAALAFALGAACGARSGGAPREPVPAFRHDDFYARLAEDAEAFTFVGGEWVESLGDAPFYGLAFYAHAARATPSPPLRDAWIARAETARRRARALITNADFATGDLQQMVMATLGLIDYADATGDKSDLPTIDAFMDRFDRLVSLIGWYLDIGGADKSWALQTYGPTSISALVGLMNAQYAHLLGGTDAAAARLDWAKQMADHIDTAAYGGSFYAFGAGRDGLIDYPNIAMIAFSARLYELSHDEKYKARALSVYDAIQPLKLSTSPTRYYSPYSADAMGAKTRDYSTLSSQSYLMLALMLLYEITGEARFVVEMDSIVDAVSTEMVGKWCLSDVHRDACAPACAESVCVASSCHADACGEAILHHWIDGRQARPSDPTFFCSGCNLQALYVLWYRRDRLR